ncbi:MAG TPA: SelB C-terminal domain-containing protein, partial [Anaerolineales bacterium]|nr:SelB C-terminal domain-containing protein [Anaerolineales bacterium]
AQGSPADVLFEAALALQIASIKDMVSKSRLEVKVAESALNELLQNGQLISLENSLKPEALAVAFPYWSKLSTTILDTVNGYHSQYPLRRGIPREELKSKLKLTPKVFNAAIAFLASKSDLVDERGAVLKPGHEIKFDGQNQVKVQALRRKFESNPYATPSVKECQAEADEEIVNALIETGELVLVSQDVIFRKVDYDEMVAKIKNTIQTQGQITLAEVRDMLNTTRKYVQALLEHLDITGVTIRDGDARKLRK